MYFDWLVIDADFQNKWEECWYKELWWWRCGGIQPNVGDFILFYFFHQLLRNWTRKVLCGKDTRAAILVFRIWHILVWLCGKINWFYK